jgi:hypothetical protein
MDGLRPLPCAKRFYAEGEEGSRVERRPRDYTEMQAKMGLEGCAGHWTTCNAKVE